MKWTSAVAIQALDERGKVSRHTERVGLLSGSARRPSGHCTAQHAISAVQRLITISNLYEWATDIGFTDISLSALHTKWQGSDYRGSRFHYASYVIHLRMCSGEQRYWLLTERWVNVRLCSGQQRYWLHTERWVNVRMCSGQQRYWLHMERWVNVLGADLFFKDL